MPRKIDDSRIDHAAKLFADGLTLKEISGEVGINPDLIGKRLRERGIDTTTNHRSRPASNRLDVDVPAIVAAYVSGESELSIAKRTGLTRIVIRRRLVEAGVDTRDGSEANKLRMARLSTEERKALASKAHDAVRGKARSEEELARRADARTRLIGFGEPELIYAIHAAGMSAEGQMPCGRYNIDVTTGNVAVEVCAAETRRLSDPKFRKRIEYIRDAGYTVVLIFFRELPFLIANMDQVVAFLDGLRRHPATSSKHWVVRCGVERFARVRNEKGQLAAVPVPERPFHIISELDL